MRDKLTTFLTVVVMMLILAVGITKAQGDPPETITYQGHLLDAANDPVPNDTYSMSFELYDDDAAGSSIWGPEAISVTTSSGYFSVLLGETEPITSGLLTTGTWLEVVVEGETMTPRHQFGSVPFALNASQVQEFTIGDLDCTDGQIARYYEGSGWLCVNTSTGDITAVNAGTGLSGGGDSGAVTVTLDYTETGDISSVVAGEGLSGGGETGSVTLTLDYTDTLGNLDCSTDQIAEYNGSSWQCTDPPSGGGGGGMETQEIDFVEYDVDEWTTVGAEFYAPAGDYHLAVYASDYGDSCPAGGNGKVRIYDEIDNDAVITLDICGDDKSWQSISSTMSLDNHRYSLQVICPGASSNRCKVDSFSLYSE